MSQESASQHKHMKLNLIILIAFTTIGFAAAEKLPSWNPISWFSYHYSEFDHDQNKLISEVSEPKGDEPRFNVKIGDNADAKTWGQILGYKLMCFWDTAQSYGHNHSWNYKSVYEAYGLLNSSNFSTVKWESVSFLKDESVQDKLIASSVSTLAKAWLKTYPTERALMRAIMADLGKWITDVNPELERAYLKALQKNNDANGYDVVKNVMIMPVGKFVNELEFVKTDPFGKARAHGKVEAFILRRILAGDISKERFVTLIGKMSGFINMWDGQFNLDTAWEAKTLENLTGAEKEVLPEHYETFDPKAFK